MSHAVTIRSAPVEAALLESAVARPAASSQRRVRLNGLKAFRGGHLGQTFAATPQGSAVDRLQSKQRIHGRSAVRAAVAVEAPAAPVADESTLVTRSDIRNIAIIAHVDHGKTTLVDAMLRQAKVFRDNQQMQERIMDSNDLERERGITILSKNTAIRFRGTKINIIDTPGHSDFGGEVERVLNMVDGVLLLVDSVEGPMPQTRFVLKKALELGHRVVVVVNKVDRPAARVQHVINATFELFCELEATDDQCDFATVYASGIQGKAGMEPDALSDDLEPLFETIIKSVPGPKVQQDTALQMLVTNLDYDEHKGRIAIGRVHAGKIARGQVAKICTPDGNCRVAKVVELFVYDNFARVPVDNVEAGDICALSGLPDVQIGETIADRDGDALPTISVEEPTVKMSFSVNVSPFAGREGKFVTSRNLRDRLMRELERNLAMKVEDGESADTFLVSGRGTLHITILIENMRREGYEFMVGPPRVINKEENGKTLEPYEEAVVEVPEEYVGAVVDMLGTRKGQMLDLQASSSGTTVVKYRVPTRGLLGLRNAMLTATRGTAVINTIFDSYGPWAGDMSTREQGSLVSFDMGPTTSYALFSCQERGQLLLGPGVEVYKGMIIGLHQRPGDLDLNACKRKAATNVRSNKDATDLLVAFFLAVVLAAPLEFSLDDCVEYIQEDELVEVTPLSVRMLKNPRMGKKGKKLQPPWTLSLDHAASERLGGGEIASYSFDVLKEAADVAVERLLIRQCGLLLPRVSIGSPSLLFIQQGSGVVELIDDNGQAPADVSPITVNSGDAVVVPKGWTYSIGNYLNESPELIITAVRFSHHKQKSYLAGSSPHSVLSGFSLHILETAFNQQHDVVRALLRQATGGGIIVSRCVPPSPPELAAQEDAEEEDGSEGDGLEGGVLEGDLSGELEEVGTGRGAVVGMRRMGSAEGGVDFGVESKKGKGKEKKGKKEKEEKKEKKKKEKEEKEKKKEKKEKKGKKEKKEKKKVVLVDHVAARKPAIVTEGGSMVRVSCRDFKALRHAGIQGEIVLLTLYPHAVVAPHIHGNAAVVFTVLKGSGHFESVHPNGTTAATDAVQAGHVGVVPMGYAHALQAGEQGVQILVAKNASKQDIKSAYRRLARQFHPDVNKDPGAEDKFKEISSAYEVLSDDEKRPLYDRFGEAGVSGSGGMGGAGAYTSNPFDLFESIFGPGMGAAARGGMGGMGGMGGAGPRTRQPVPGDDVKMEMPLEFREVIFGAEKTINVAHLDGCSECGGSGAKAGTSPRTCPTCRGMGQVMQTRQTAFGMFSSVRFNAGHLDGCSECGGSGAKAGTSPRTCPTCRGMGQVMQTRQTAFGMFSSVRFNGVGEVISEFCRKCGGEGRVRTRKPVVINVPAGVDSGTVLRVKGEGDAGMRGGKRGDLYVFVKVKETMGIRRDGINLYSNVSIDYTDAILGTVAKVATVDGAAELRVPAGTQPGDTLVLERKGVPKVGKSNIRGDHFFQVNVSIPKRVSPTERDLVEELASIHKTGKTRTGITVEGARPRGSSSSSGVDGEGIVDTVKTVFSGIKDFFSK
ncbi:unnamed protein product [Closterium sp. Naga37s-1]|nr:unnamed protein product [Closterium sp. Naga37s-1]